MPSCSRCDCSIDYQRAIPYQFNDDIYYLTLCESCAIQYEDYEQQEHIVHCIECNKCHSTEYCCVGNTTEEENEHVNENPSFENNAENQVTKISQQKNLPVLPTPLKNPRVWGEREERLTTFCSPLFSTAGLKKYFLYIK